MAKKKEELSSRFSKGNFSCDLRNEVDKKENFVKKYAGMLTTDVSKLHADIVKAKKAYDKANPTKVDTIEK